jgi:hypothetical protein
MRDPLKCISSLHFHHFTKLKRKGLEKHIGHHYMEFANYHRCGTDGEEFWFRWNRKIRRIATHRIRIEEFDTEAAIKLLKFLGAMELNDGHREAIGQILDTLDRKLNHTAEVPQLTGFNNEQTRELAVELGYTDYE